MYTSGLVLDVYDDTGGEVLRSIFPTVADIPDRVKTAAALSLEDRDRLPDDLFALVLVEGDSKTRKYACADSGNTVLSTVYFMKTASKLPGPAQKIAAMNLCEAHRWYGLRPPPALEKLALGLGTALSVLTAPAVAKGTHQAIKENLANVRNLEGAGNIITPANLRQAKFGEATGTNLMPLSAPSAAEIKSKAVLKKTGTVSIPAIAAGTLAAATLVGGTLGHLKGKEHGEPGKGALRGAGGALLGTAAAMPLGIHSGFGLAMGGQDDAAIAAMSGVAAMGGLVGYKALTHKYTKEKKGAEVAGEKGHWGETLHNGDGTPGEQAERLPQSKQVHFVVTKEQTEHPAITEKKAATYALGDKFPLDSLLQIKAAAAYFDEFGKRFSPEDRRGFCAALVKTAAKLNLPLSEEVRKYGSPFYAPLAEMKVACDLRRGMLEPHSHEVAVLERLFEKRAEITPDLFCAALGELDRATGLDFHYDRALPDPYYSTFGMEKRAESFSEVIGNEMTTEEDLDRLGRNGGLRLKTTFSDEFCAEFQKDPVGIFKSLPRDQRLVVMRMANCMAPGEPT